MNYLEAGRLLQLYLIQTVNQQGTTYKHITSPIGKKIINHGKEILPCIGEFLRYFCSLDSKTKSSEPYWIALIWSITGEYTFKTPAPDTLDSIEEWIQWLLGPQFITYEPVNLNENQAILNAQDGYSVGYWAVIFDTYRYTCLEEAVKDRTYIQVGTVKSNTDFYFFKLVHMGKQNTLYMRLENLNEQKDIAQQHMDQLLDSAAILQDEVTTPYLN